MKWRMQEWKKHRANLNVLLSTLIHLLLINSYSINKYIIFMYEINYYIIVFAIVHRKSNRYINDTFNEINTIKHHYETKQNHHNYANNLITLNYLSHVPSSNSTIIIIILHNLHISCNHTPQVGIDNCSLAYFYCSH